MAYKETDFISKMLRPYLKKSNWKTSIIEAKVSAGKTMPFSGFQFHQLPTLKKASEDQIIFKPSDMALGIKPADIFVINRENAWVAILFEKEKTPRRSFYMIKIWDVLTLKTESGKKSITKKDCEDRGLLCSL